MKERLGNGDICNVFCVIRYFDDWVGCSNRSEYIRTKESKEEKGERKMHMLVVFILIIAVSIALYYVIKDGE